MVRQTLHDWLRRYARGGMAALRDRSSKPGTCPHQMPAEVEARIATLRREHPGWGPATLLHRLEQQGVSPLPSRSGLYRALVRHGLIERTKRKRSWGDYKRWERSWSMELWQMDIVGGVKLADGGEASIVTGIDDHSRFCVSAKVVARATAKPVCEALRDAVLRHGVPEGILTDNGKVFTGRFGLNPNAEVLFDRIRRENGIKHLLTAPYSPTTTGKVERFHKTLRAGCLTGKASAPAGHPAEPGGGRTQSRRSRTPGRNSSSTRSWSGASSDSSLDGENNTSDRFVNRGQVISGGPPVLPVFPSASPPPTPNSPVRRPPDTSGPREARRIRAAQPGYGLGHSGSPGCRTPTTCSGPRETRSGHCVVALRRPNSLPITVVQSPRGRSGISSAGTATSTMAAALTSVNRRTTVLASSLSTHPPASPPHSRNRGLNPQGSSLKMALGATTHRRPTR